MLSLRWILEGHVEQLSSVSALCLVYDVASVSHSSLCLSFLVYQIRVSPSVT